MNWTLLVTKPAKRALEKLPSREQIRIERVLALMEHDPFRGGTSNASSHQGGAAASATIRCSTISP
jgi:mRNA-degrading endonuclease RelE of RelBE toxin-antitoxin system